MTAAVAQPDGTPYPVLVADAVLRAMHLDAAPWTQAWRGQALPFNPETGRSHKGSNKLFLMCQGFAEAGWVSLAQGQRMGAILRPGEAGTSVVQWQTTEQKIKRNWLGRQVLDEQGKPVKETVKLQQPRQRFLTLYNVEQFDGLERTAPAEPSWDRVLRCDALLRESGAVSEERRDAQRAHYYLESDTLVLPPRGAFGQPDQYYAVVLRGLAAWTSNSERLGRDAGHSPGTVGYFRETLRTEIAAATMGHTFGVRLTKEEHHPHTRHWEKLIRRDPRELFRAAADAERIVDYVLALERGHERESQQPSSSPVAKALGTAVGAVGRLAGAPRSAPTPAAEERGPVQDVQPDFAEPAKQQHVARAPQPAPERFVAGPASAPAHDSGAPDAPEMLRLAKQLVQAHGELEALEESRPREPSDEDEEGMHRYEEYWEQRSHAEKVVGSLMDRWKQEYGRRDPASELDKWEQTKCQQARSDALKAELGGRRQARTKGGPDMPAVDAQGSDRDGGGANRTGAKGGGAGPGAAAKRGGKEKASRGGGSRRRWDSSGRPKLAVPYKPESERKAAYDLGARWDKAVRVWFVPDGVDPNPLLERWSPDRADVSPPEQGDPQAEFTAHLLSLGFIVDRGHPIMDGQKHYCRVEGDRGSKKSGMYFVHTNNVPAGYAKNHRTKQSGRWVATGYVLDAEDRARLQAVARARAAQNEEARQTQLEEVATKVAKRLAGLSVPSEPTPYLQAKGLQPSPQLRVDAKGVTHVAAIDSRGKVWNAQRIFPDGRKRFEKGARIQGCFHVIGGLKQLATAQVIAVAEGYSTGATIAMVSGRPVVVAFDSENLALAAKAVVERFPDKPVAIFADDDRHNAANPQIGYNTGVRAAEDAAKVVRGEVVVPKFAPGEQDPPSREMKDFNDLATKSAAGWEGTRKQVFAGLRRALDRQRASERARPAGGALGGQRRAAGAAEVSR
ncbi:MAG: zincin-like metallopeptidase domain-containing protein [Myxococcales bacterium]|nr:zincin-like metallopeptidase domain-containing protein [Myxococcales bacterium]